MRSATRRQAIREEMVRRARTAVDAQDSNLSDLCERAIDAITRADSGLCLSAAARAVNTARAVARGLLA